MKVPYLYFNFRVYSASTGTSEEDQLFYKDHERKAVELARSTGGITVCLCQLDRQLLEGLAVQESSYESNGGSCGSEIEGRGQVQILMPPLRHDVRMLAMAEDGGGGGAIFDTIFDSRRFITCCARLTAEKNVQHFVAAVSAISAELQAAGIVPYLIGSPTDPAYAEETKAALKKAFPGEASVVEDFQPPDRLAEIFLQTRLNVHPALYEAYGMTVAEAAAFGAPTLLDGGGGIGVAGLLPPPEFACATDMRDVAATAASIMSALGLDGDSGVVAVGGDEDAAGEPGGLRLVDVAAAARAKSLGWGEQQLGDELQRMLLDAIPPVGAV
jgi:glycosyltransferase involved in cell wall biosynthesis